MGTKRTSTFLVIFLFFLLSNFSVAQQATNIDVSTTVVQPAVKRLGINLGTQTFYDSGIMMQNLAFRNPGFEPGLFRSVIQCASGTATTCIDAVSGGNWPAGFWSGAQYEFIWGAAKGRTGTVSNSTANVSAAMTLTFADSAKVPGKGDFVALRKKIPGNGIAGWWTSVGGGGTITTGTTDLPPGTSGTQVARLTALSSGQYASVQSFIDSTPNMTFIQLNGSYQLSFKAKGVGGANQMAVQVFRLTSPSITYLNQTITLTSSWNTYTLTFNAAEGGNVVGTIQASLGTAGQSDVLLDDVSLVRVNGDPTNNTAFRDPVVSALRTLNPGLLRYWGGQLGESLDNQVAPQFARMPSDFSRWNTTPDQIQIGLHEFLQLCETLGTEPWYVIPITFSTSEMSNLIQYLSGAATTTYGAKRAALGHPQPWSDVFPTIHLEFGNEAWNSTFSGGSMEVSVPYGNRAGELFGAARAAAGFDPTRYDLVIGGQAAWPGRNQEIASAASNYDSLAVAPYQMNDVDNYADNEQLFGPAFAEPEMMNTAGGIMVQNANIVRPNGKGISVYEVNLSTTGGSISQAALDSFTPSLGGGMAVASNMLLMLREQGARNQMLFALPQYTFGRPDRKTDRLWGSVVDMGVTDRRRPQFLALQLINQALSGDMVQTTLSGANPTWNQALMNGVQLNNAHYLQSYAFSNGSAKGLVLFNLHRSSALPVTFSGTNAPSGTVTFTRLGSTNLTDTNETANVVGITSQTVSGFNPSAGLSLPAYSITVATWTAATGPPLQISNVAAGGVTGTSATVTWTTNVASTSQLFYGTTPALGQSTILAPAAVTSHTVTLSGLAGNTTYYYQVASQLTNGSPVLSPVSTFTTLDTIPPIITSVTATAGTTAAVVNWATNEPSNTQVEYGLTSSYGQQTTVDPTMVTGHSTSLTGLASSTVYYYRVKSRDAAGNLAVSPGYTFTTLTPPPPFNPIRVNAGGTLLTDPLGLVWDADYGYSGGSKSTKKVTVSGTTTTGIYQAMRTSGTTFEYNFTVPNNFYYVTLKFADFNNTAVGKRVFNILINGQVVASNFDIVREAGGGSAAVDRRFPVTVTKGTLNITFNAVVGSAAVSGIEIATSVTPISIGLTPPTGTLSASQTLQLQPAVTGTTNTGVIWTLTPPTGTISSTGLYTAPSSIATDTSVTVSATSVAQPATAATAVITLKGRTAGPVISALSSWNLTANGIVIAWAIDQPADGQVEYGTTPAFGQFSALNSALQLNQQFQLTGLQSGVTYYYRARSKNAAGGLSLSATQTFTTPDTVPAVVSNVLFTQTGANTGTVTLNTNEPADAQVQYGPTTAYGWWSSLSPVGTSFSLPLTWVTPGTLHLRVRARDVAQNVTLTQDYVFTVR